MVCGMASSSEPNPKASPIAAAAFLAGLATIGAGVIVAATTIIRTIT